MPEVPSETDFSGLPGIVEGRNSVPVERTDSPTERQTRVIHGFALAANWEHPLYWELGAFASCSSACPADSASADSGPPLLRCNDNRAVKKMTTGWTWSVSGRPIAAELGNEADL